MLLIMDPEVRHVLNMRDCIEAMERAFAEEARGVAVNKPRTRYKVPPDLDKPGYMANIIPGAVPSSGVAALRYDSTIVQERMICGNEKNGFSVAAQAQLGFRFAFQLADGGTARAGS
jgi:ornithine cyclodeaminase/alanine dehydrogenase-like protein (mu-crystallin family)